MLRGEAGGRRESSGGRVGVGGQSLSQFRRSRTWQPGTRGRARLQVPGVGRRTLTQCSEHSPPTGGGPSPSVHGGRGWRAAASRVRANGEGRRWREGPLVSFVRTTGGIVPPASCAAGAGSGRTRRVCDAASCGCTLDAPGVPKYAGILPAAFTQFLHLRNCPYAVLRTSDAQAPAASCRLPIASKTRRSGGVHAAGAKQCWRFGTGLVARRWAPFLGKGEGRDCWSLG